MRWRIGVTSRLLGRLLGLLLAGLAMFDAQAAEPLTAAALVGYAPYSDSDLPQLGFSNDLLAQAMQRKGHTVKFVLLPWARALSGAEAGAYDILPTSWYTAERAEKLLFSEPFALNRLVFVKRRGSPFDYTELSDLDGKTVGTVIDYAYGEAFVTSTRFEREPVYDPEFNLRKLIAGRIDLAIDDELTLRYLLRVKAPDLADKLELTKGALSERALYMAFPKSRPGSAALLAEFNAALAEMQQDGTYAAILKAHALE